MRRLTGIIVTAVLGLGIVLGTQGHALASPAAAPHVSRHQVPSIGNIMLDWAETQAGKPYIWGATGPYGYDCSGLVVAAARHYGLVLPRTTYEMVRSARLVRTYRPVRGDLAFWGPAGAPYHVEFVTVWHGTGFGAMTSGVPVGYDHWWTSPTAYYRIER